MRWKTICKLLPLVALFLCAACVAVPPARVAGPEIHLLQISPAWGAGYLRGPAYVQYELIVRNWSNETLDLTGIELRSVRGGAYSLRRQTQPLHRIVPPYATVAVRFWAIAWFHGGELTAYEAVRIRGVAQFQTRHGVSQGVFFEVIP